MVRPESESFSAHDANLHANPGRPGQRIHILQNKAQPRCRSGGKHIDSVAHVQGVQYVDRGLVTKQAPHKGVDFRHRAPADEFEIAQLEQKPVLLDTQADVARIGPAEVTPAKIALILPKAESRVINAHAGYVCVPAFVQNLAPHGKPEVIGRAQVKNVDYPAIETLDCVDLWRIGKLNHRKSAIDWPAFGRKVEALCLDHGRNYYIKEDLRRVMEA